MADHFKFLILHSVLLS